ncbi:MAG: Cytochrome c-type biogenesis protein DsbD, protein-disulfide reductase [Candidatus Ozemobacter sibiricus]|uniref:Cytochrome c-type biogenesis protein DsbD, protein-disulfide reductase n=1 Tax=Candidatus Ozemobacter sibiricus TaxID=2268124 RepID=A0A367ZPZ2_9BACT|nr:MAG: Cytochrome c-type biogenesis protein DsbD, protein-disulfide reductase [Candidatus Ozemobacter sibiricus]
MRVCLSIWLMVLGTMLALAAGAGPLLATGLPDTVETEQVRLQLISEATGMAPGQPLTVGIHMTFKEGWHAYWMNPGDSGMPPTFTFTLPPGFQAGEVQWPFPTRLPGAGEVIYGYEGNALFLCTIQVPPSVVPGERHSIRMDVSGLLCSADACLPFEAALQLTLPVTAEPPARDERWQKLFAEGRHRLPGTPAGWVFEATATPDQKYRIAITPPAGQSVPGTVHFFPFTSDAIKPSAPQILEPPAEGRPATLIVERGFADPGPTLKGVLTGAGGWGPEPIAGWGAVEVSIPVVTR